jgi:protein O-GlcNAc transferase
VELESRRVMAAKIPALQRAEALCRRGAWVQAAEAYSEALRLAPDHVDARYNLGLLLLRQGDLANGLAQLQHAAKLAPKQAVIHLTIGRAQQALKRPTEAARAFREAVRLNPALTTASVELASLLVATGRPQEAEELLSAALRQGSSDDDLEATLGLVYSAQARWAEAAETLSRVVERSPQHRAALRNLVQVENRLKRADRVVSLAARYLAQEPDDAGIRSTYLMTRLYVSGDAEEMLRLARNWADARARASPPAPLHHANPPDPERRLRVGFVSRQLRSHPVGYFIAGFVREHDPGRIELHAYSNSREDWLTRALRQNIERWNEIGDISDAELARRITDDRVDVLFDVSGLEAHNRGSLFAMRPAPVQVTGFGHFSTTGLGRGHYLLADRFHIPDGFERYYSEEIVRLPHSYISYIPPPYAPLVAPPPALARGAVTFGSFNNLLKLSDTTVALWAAVLARCPTATLLLRDRELDTEAVRSEVCERFARAGVGPERLRLLGGAAHREFLDAYREIDIALDPHPYSGGLTTLEALWMGVPVVTLSGTTFCSRHSTSHLSNVGLERLVSDSPERYVEIACSLATDVEALARLRISLRQRLGASALCDTKGYSRALEEKLRGLWRGWCSRVRAATE